MPTKASTRRTPGPDRRLAGQGDQPDLRRVLHVRAAAQLARPGATHLDDADLLVVRLAEQRQRADLPRGGQRHVVRGHVEVGPDGLVGGLLDVGADLLAQPARPGEVEPQVAGLVVRAALQRGRAEHLPQRRVHHVGARVGLAGAEPPLAVDRGQHVRCRCSSSPSVTRTRCTIRPLTGRCTSTTSSSTPSPVIGAGVGVLAAGLGVERGSLEHDLDRVALGSAASTSSPSTTMPRTFDSVAQLGVAR